MSLAVGWQGLPYDILTTGDTGTPCDVLVPNWYPEDVDLITQSHVMSLYIGARELP